MHDSMIENVNISFLNTKNIKSNLPFAKYLTEISQISYFNEIWLKKKEIHILKSICPAKKKLIFKSDIPDSYKCGRPFGGQCWIYDTSFEMLAYDFLSRHVSYIHLKKNNKEFILVGVYMPFDDPRKKLDSLTQYELSLSLISGLINKSESNSTPIFIIGDFNADLNRNNPFDSILKSYIDSHSLSSLIYNFNQKVKHTFSYTKNDQTYFLNLDHILYKNNNTNFIHVNKCAILDNVANMSDHQAVQFQFSLAFNPNDKTNHDNYTRLPGLDFNNPEILITYNNNIEKCISETPQPSLHEGNKQNFINEQYSFITKILTQAKKLTISDLLLDSHPTRKKQTNPWFTPQLKNIKSELVHIRNSLQKSYDVNLAKRRKFLKKEFRKIQRQNIHLLELKELNKFENFSLNSNKDKFWNFIRKSNKKHSHDVDPTIPAAQLITHYSKFFFENYTLDQDQQNIKTHVNSLYSQTTPEISPPLFSQPLLNSIVHELKNSDVEGYDKTSYSMIKFTNSNNFNSLLLDFFNNIIRLAVIPHKFNTSIIKPIIKDQNKSTSDTNNIRPLSISNALAQIFERLILSNSPLLHKMHKNQFGFKKNTSCNHAIFVLKETILRYINNKSSCKIASLDAEKAFDKIWRDGLFFKLHSKMNHSYWTILKKYYDSSQGAIASNNTFLLFDINCGVKQGGILSPYLFNVFINDLIEECINSNLGAIFKSASIPIIVYADDIILISPVDSHLQKLLDLCGDYSNKWLIKFNQTKSNIITFGTPLFHNTVFTLNNIHITQTDKIKYLGIEINQALDFDLCAIEKFKNVSKQILTLSHLGITPKGVSPNLKSFLYKTFCLSQFTYALETSTLKKATCDRLNVSQNNLVRQFIGLNKHCHISDILKSLRIFNFHELYLYSKLSFLKTIKNNELSTHIFDTICLEKNEKKKCELKKSFINDVFSLESQFNIEIEIILADPNRLKQYMKINFDEGDGLTDSIKFCLNQMHNKNNKFHKNLLNNLIRPEFLNEYIAQMNEII